MQHVRYICTDCLTSHSRHLHARPGSGKRSVSCVQNFNEIPSEITSSNNQMIPSFFLLNVIFALKKFSINEDREINQLNPDTFENYGKNLAISVWKSYTIVKENQKSLENPESLDEYHKTMPKNLTSFFN
nr:5624_t:CDS:2 [Entrophospora candida]